MYRIYIYTWAHLHLLCQAEAYSTLHTLSDVEVNPMLHSNISKYILYTVLYTFLKVLKGGICLTIKSFINWRSFYL